MQQSFFRPTGLRAVAAAPAPDSRPRPPRAAPAPEEDPASPSHPSPSTSASRAAGPYPMAGPRFGPLSTVGALGIRGGRRRLMIARSTPNTGAAEGPDYRQYRGQFSPLDPYNPGSYSRHQYNEYLTGSRDEDSIVPPMSSSAMIDGGVVAESLVLHPYEGALPSERRARALETTPDGAAGAGGAAANGAPDEGAATEGVARKGMPHRWQVVMMMAVSFILCNMDKVNMSVAVIPMAAEFGWSNVERGLVSSSFFWGYSLTQTPAGYLATRIGGAKVLALGVALWSLGTLIAPPAAQLGIMYLCATRVFVGLGEGLAPSAVTNVMASKMPERERARAVTTVFGGLDVGSAVGLLICGPLIRAYGWPIVFYLFAGLGFIWCILWPLVKPEQNLDAVEKRQSYIQDMVNDDFKAIAKSDKAKPVPWGKFLRSAPVWAVITAHFCFNWGYYTLLAWLPSYFELALGLNVEKSSLLTLIPYLSMTAMTPLVGPVADGLVQRGWEITNVRKLCQGISFLGPAICMLACAFFTPVNAGLAAPHVIPMVVGLLSFSFALGAWARGGLYCNHQDLSPKYAGALLGLSNTAGALPGVLGVTLAGYLLDKSGSWAHALFIPTACCQIFGLVIYTMFASSKRQEGWQ